MLLNECFVYGTINIIEDNHLALLFLLINFKTKNETHTS